MTSQTKKLFVLDTNVLLHDPTSIHKFEEHDVFIPHVTLEELDGKKSGQEDVNRNAREATRLIGKVVGAGGDFRRGFPMQDLAGHRLGNMHIQREALRFLDGEYFQKNDNMFLAVLKHLEERGEWDDVVLITKDLNLRVKALAMGFKAQDYEHDHLVEDEELVYRGIRELDDDKMDELLGSATVARTVDIHPEFVVPRSDLRINEFITRRGTAGELYRVRSIDEAQSTAVLRKVVDYSKTRNAVLSVAARNAEQAAAFDLLMDPSIDLVALLGQAGAGKTLLTLAAALAQCGLAKGATEVMFDDVIYTRAIIPIGNDIGAVPGDETEKMRPWLEAVYDALDYISGVATANEVEGHKIREEATKLIHLKALTFMRGRSFLRRMLIIDEAQNLTPKQMKTLVTRAGEDTKLVVMGNLAQIDSPYLSETSSGLTYLVERFKGWPHFGALVMQSGQRSRLATKANEVL